MRATRLMWIVLLSGTGAGCAATASHAGDGLRTEAGLVQSTPQERRELHDSAVAQSVADEVGPRVTVTADFDYAGGSRRVDSRFHMYDDAYVIVGHLDAAGRLKIVFPSEPGDDGFVRGEKIYQVPSFFAGFGDEYAWSYQNYRSQAHNAGARHDSYDAGLGYVFVIASWRPMRLDRITDGNRWLSYEISDISYMYDPREAIEELGSVIAGDNREAYTIEYAHYSTTNYGTYSLASFDAFNSGSCYGYSSGFGYRSLFFSPAMFLPNYGFGFGSVGCNRGYGYGYGYAYPVSFGPTAVAPPIIPRGRPTVPIGPPVFHSPRLPGSGTVALHRPRPEASPPATPGGESSATQNGNSPYRRPGLIAEDAPSRPRGQGRVTGAEIGSAASRPTIQQMIGSRRIADEARERARAGFYDAGARGSRGSETSWPSTNRGGVSAPRNVEGGTRMGNGGGGQAVRESPRGNDGGTRGYTPARAEGAHSSSARSEPRGESARSTPPHSEPAPRPAPAPAATSSSGSQSQKKP
jgi:hypothetical protein